MLLKEVFDKTVIFFKDKGFESPRLDAEILFSEALGFKNRMDLYLKFDRILTQTELEKCRSYVRRRTQEEPIAYIVGKKTFLHWDFLVTSDVLIPRPETEILSEWIVDQLILIIKKISTENLNSKKIKIRLFDFGSGSGCLGLGTLLLFQQKFSKIFNNANNSKSKMRPLGTSTVEDFGVNAEDAKLGIFSGDKKLNIDFKLVGFDVSESAINIAKQNAKMLNINSAEFVMADLNQTDSQEIIKKANTITDANIWNEKNEINEYLIQVIAANPPYIDKQDPLTQESVKKFEPNLALFSEENGMKHIRCWADLVNELFQSNKRVESEGVTQFFGFEIGHNQGIAAKNIFEQKNNFRNLKVLTDYSGKDRFVVGFFNNAL